MGLIEIFADGSLTFYIIAGSTSLGYIFLRLGWPDVRALDRQYKAGWSIIIGLVFSAIVVISALAFSLNPFFQFGFRESLLLNISVTFIAATTLLTIKRKFLTSNKMRVSVPSTLLGAKVTATKVVEQLERDPGFIRSAKFEGEKLDELKKRLDRNEAPGIIPQFNKISAKPQQKLIAGEAKQGKFAAQQIPALRKETVSEFDKDEVKQPIAPTEKQEKTEPEKPSWPPAPEKKLLPTTAEKAAQKEEQAKKLDKVEELRRILDERLLSSKQEAINKPAEQKPVLQKPAEIRQPESKPQETKQDLFSSPLDKLKKIAGGKTPEEKAREGWPMQKSGEQKQMPQEMQKPQASILREPVPEVKKDTKPTEEKKPKPEVRPASLEGNDEDNVLERLLEEKQKEIEKLKKARKV